MNPKSYKDIEGWFDWEELYTAVVTHAPSNPRIVEVGSWKGRSTAFLASECLRLGKGSNTNVWSVDTWKGSPGEQTGVLAQTEDVWEQFYDNLTKLRLLRPFGPVQPLRSDSGEAARNFTDASMDMVFLDAAHNREAVLMDLTAWYPKVKPGGTFAGHDFTHHWPGVTSAVLEFFHGRPFDVRGSCWIHRKV